MTPLLNHQLTGAQGIRHFGGCALLADEMGLGKSLTSLYWMHKMPSTRPAIIVCPANAKVMWEREASHHLNMWSEVLRGRTPPRAGLRGHAPILIINYEILHHWLEYLIALQPRLVLWDEAHYIGNRNSLRFKTLKKLIDGADVPYRIALSGTPLTNRPFELWPSLRLVLPDMFRSPIEFGFEYCDAKLVRGKWEFSGAKNLGKLHAILKEHCMIRRKKSEVAKDMPAKIRKMVPLELNAVDRKEYDFASHDFMRWLRVNKPGRVHRAQKAPHLTRVGYLLRLVAKLKRFQVKDWIDSFLQESDEKLVVFSCHTKMLDWLELHYPGETVRIDGTVTGDKRQQSIDQFQSQPRKRIALCHPKSAGVALTLTAACHVLYTDFPWAPGTLKQGEDRVHRIGQTKACFIWFLAVRDTIEERLCELLEDKQEILDKVLDGIEGGQDFDIFKELLTPTKGTTKWNS